jgi:ATP-dependent DNA helicase RecG
MPSSIEKLRKFIALETERGYDNRAIVGGLDKILPIWTEEARSSGIPVELVENISARISSYPSLDPQGRTQILNEILDELTKTVISEKIVSVPSKVEIEKTPQTQSVAADNISQRPTKLPTPNRTYSGANIGLNAPLTVLDGIGKHHALTLQSLGLRNLGDLLYYFPRRYDDYSQMKPINRLQYGDELSILASVYSCTSRPVRGGQMQLTEAVVTDGTGFLRLTWFNRPFIAAQLVKDTQLVVSGKVDQFLGRLVMTNPEFELLEREHLHTNRIVPVYSVTSRISQKVFRRLMFQAVPFWAPRVPEFLPSDIRQSAGLVDLAVALHQIHFPDNNEKLTAARARLAFDEIFLLQLGVLRQKIAWQRGSATIFSQPQTWWDSQQALLPFTLTNAQLHVLEDIRADLTSGKPMNRLLQGDVGSGKTIVAALAMAAIAQQAGQSALMAPTGILAEQHYRSLLRLLASAENQLLEESQICLLVGSTPDAEKERIKVGLVEGSIRIVVGTHALIEDPVVFKNLEFVVVDEQHRFGVAQRAALRSKGQSPHLMVMTATPIPRSLALTVYGDLDLTVMDEMPAGRIPIETHVLSPLDRERAYQLIRTQVKQNHQAFIIYPLVEKGDNDDVKAAVEERERLSKEVFPSLKIGLLHGRMKTDEKDQVMSQFHAGELQILVSTSVVEVGVDVPNATVMLVEGADHFGLSQLHQFRGRVGRGKDPSYCLLIPETDSAVENERLAVMAETNDGFVLAERDLQQRGPGDFLGTRQSGFAELKMANLTDIRLIEKARVHAQKLFEQDPELIMPEHNELATTLRRFWQSGQGDIS